MHQDVSETYLQHHNKRQAPLASGLTNYRDTKEGTTDGSVAVATTYSSMDHSSRNRSTIY